MEDSTILGLFGLLLLAMCLLPVGIVVLYRKLEQNADQKRKEEERRYENGEMTAAERKSYVEKNLKKIEQMYRYGDITLLEFELLKKKYTGESTYLDHGGLALTVAASNKMQVERAIAQHQKKAERDLVFQATVGGAINGLSGTIIGATASANKSAQEAAELEAARAAAESEYRQAIDDL